MVHLTSLGLASNFIDVNSVTVRFHNKYMAPHPQSSREFTHH